MTDELDRVLGEALRARPELMPGADLAARASGRARAEEARFGRLAMLARWTRVASAAAGILLLVILTVGYSEWRAGDAGESSTVGSETTGVITAAGGDANTSEPLAGGLTVLVGAMVVCSIASLLSADRAARVRRTSSMIGIYGRLVCND